MQAMSDPGSDSFVIVGRLGTAHGIKGWLKVTSFTEPRENLFDYSPWYIKRNGDWQVIDVEAARAQGKGLVVQLKGVGDRNEALALRGTDIAVSRDQLPALEQDEYYWTDLVGLTVVTTEDVLLGVVTEVFATGANDVLVVEANDKRRLVPFVQGQVIKQIDLDSARMCVDWDPDF